METKDPKSTETTGSNTKTEATEPDSTATSSDTLSDVEETEKVTSGGDDDGDNNSASDAPSPDGQFDEGGSGKTGNDPGPM
ncbi:MAG TPA: hypothetical protein VGC64_01110 [Pyrinomonadaceae bacterium]|jgi:hypothetical protein